MFHYILNSIEEQQLLTAKATLLLSRSQGSIVSMNAMMRLLSKIIKWFFAIAVCSLLAAWYFGETFKTSQGVRVSIVNLTYQTLFSTSKENKGSSQKTTTQESISTSQENIVSTFTLAAQKSATVTQVNSMQSTSSTTQKSVTRAKGKISSTAILREAWRNAVSRPFNNITKRVYPCNADLLHTKTISTFIGAGYGNQLFQYASTYGLARQFNRTPVITATKLSHAAFPNLSACISEGPGNISMQIEVVSGHIYKPEIAQFLSNHSDVDHIQVFGFLSSFMYFHKYSDEIRREFEFNPRFISARNAFFEKQVKLIYGDAVRSSEVLYIGVHIRRGFSPRKGYAVADVSYLEKAVDYMEQNTKWASHKIYIACSNTIRWAKENFKAPHPVVFCDAQPGKGSPLADMAALAGCNHSIITSGTFSWWSGYLAGGMVVYYRAFPTANTSLANRSNKTQYYFPEWKGID